MSFMSSNGVTKTSSRRKKTAPKLKESCDCCSAAKVRCTRERPSCLRCQSKGTLCQYSYSRRAGRKLRSGAAISLSTSDSDENSRHGSPLSSTVEPSFPHFERTMSTSSSSSSSTSSLADYQRMAMPEYASPQLSETLNDTHSLDMWSFPPFATTPDELNTDWYQLADDLDSAFQPDHHHFSQFKGVASSPHTPPSEDNESIRESIECASSPAFDTEMAHHLPFLQHEPRQGSFLFAETEAIREELRLVANYVSTLEERVNRGLRCAGLHQQNAMEANALCGVFEAVGDLHACAAAEDLATMFDASNLRKRLGRVRYEIECIVGFG